MFSILHFLAEQPLITFGVVVMLGMAIGRVTVGGISLGAAGILFAAIGVAAWGTAENVTISVPEPIGFLGLSLFAFATGVVSGPGFFDALRSSWLLMLAVAVVICCGAAVTLTVGRALGLDPHTIAGVFAGSRPTRRRWPRPVAVPGQRSVMRAHTCSVCWECWPPPRCRCPAGLRTSTLRNRWSTSPFGWTACHR